MLRRVAFLLFMLLLLYEAIEYYAVSSVELLLVEPVGSVETAEGPRLLLRVYYDNPIPLHVHVLALAVELECDGAAAASQAANLSLPGRSSTGLFVSVRAERLLRDTCTAKARADLTTSLLRVLKVPLVRKTSNSSFELPRAEVGLLWAGWNTTWVEAGGCAEAIVLAPSGVSYTAYVVEESYGRPPEKKAEFSGQGNATSIFCAPPKANPLVVRGYFIVLELRDLGVVWTQSSSYPPRLRLRG
uniref:Late embryogenesis abundant protein LEA-2 subgroup domain-containing protein n=1 Tax=Thermofilum pendens TaxID=2269 RepID=A0A7C3SP68_THEPE